MCCVCFLYVPSLVHCNRRVGIALCWHGPVLGRTRDQEPPTVPQLCGSFCLSAVLVLTEFHLPIHILYWVINRHFYKKNNKTKQRVLVLIKHKRNQCWTSAVWASFFSLNVRDWATPFWRSCAGTWVSKSLKSCTSCPKWFTLQKLFVMWTILDVFYWHLENEEYQANESYQMCPPDQGDFITAGWFIGPAPSSLSSLGSPAPQQPGFICLAD